MSSIPLSCILLFLFALSAVAATAPVKDLGQDSRDSSAVELGRSDHNYSCIFDNYRAFSYLHIGYAPYFNLSNRSPSYATTDECLDSCTADCSCAAIVYDVPKDACYQYHDYIPVQSIQLLPVNPHDTISAYIKIQRGSPNGFYYSRARPRILRTAVTLALALVLVPLLF